MWLTNLLRNQHDAAISPKPTAIAQMLSHEFSATMQIPMVEAAHERRDPLIGFVFASTRTNPKKS
jgi:hypothetical protein